MSSDSLSIGVIVLALCLASRFDFQSLLNLTWIFRLHARQYGDTMTWETCREIRDRLRKSDVVYWEPKTIEPRTINREMVVNIGEEKGRSCLSLGRPRISARPGKERHWRRYTQSPTATSTQSTNEPTLRAASPDNGAHVGPDWTKLMSQRTLLVAYFQVILALLVLSLLWHFSFLVRYSEDRVEQLVVSTLCSGKVFDTSPMLK